MMSEQRDGFVIALALVVMLLLELLAAGMLLVAMQERAIANARIAMTTGRTRAETTVARQVAAWAESDHAHMRVGEVRTTMIDSTTVRIERLRGDLFLLTGQARLGGPAGGSARATLILRAFDVNLILQQLTGALVTATPTQLLGNTIIDASAAPVCAWPGMPAGIATPFPELLATGSVVTIAGQPDILRDTLPREPPPRFGGLDTRELSALATRSVSGTLTPAPADVDRACDEAAPANWGSPLDPRHPCAGFFPFIFADGDLEIAGGVGQGLLVVTGNLVMRAGARFHGLVIVGGSLFISAATVAGAVVVQSPNASTILLDATIDFDPCAVDHALFDVPSLRRPLFPPGRIWLPTH